MKNKFWNIFRIIILIFNIAISSILVKLIINLNIVPNKYLYIGIIVLIILNIICSILLLGNRLVTKIIGILLSVVIIITSLVGTIYINSLENLLSKAFNNNKIEITGYGVVVKKESEYKKLKDLDNKKMGYLNIDDTDYLKKISSKIDNKMKEYDDVYNLYEDLLNDKIDAFVIDKAYLDLLEDKYENIDNYIKVIYTFEEKTKLENKSVINDLESINIFISGSDARTDTIAERSRSDVNMIMTINPKTHTILLTSIPRDYYVKLHGKTGLNDKLTHAGIYGVNMSRDTVADLFDIKIDYTIKVGFKSVEEVVDLIGGIDVNSDITFNSYHIKGWVVKEGANHFNGKQALAYSRERYAYIDGDIHRVQNQQQVLEAILVKIFKDKSLLKKYDKVLESFSQLYRTDIPIEYIKMIVKDQIENMNSWNIERQYVTGSGAMLETYSMPRRNLWVMIPDNDSMESAKIKINEIYNEE